MEASTRECLKSFCASRTGKVIKKLDFPAPQPLTESLKENRLVDMMHQADGHTFVNNADIMTISFQNAMLKATGRSNIKVFRTMLSQLVASIPESSTAARGKMGAQSADQSTDPEPLQVIPLTDAPIFTTSALLISSSVQDGSA